MTHPKHTAPEPTTEQIRYSRLAATRLAIDLMYAAADALMTGKPMRKPRLPRASPAEDAVTARSLQIIATALTDYTRANTSNEE